MRISSRRLVAAAALLIFSRIVRAQELRGTVREAVTGQPVSGAVLLLLDSLGETHARNITDERGVYRIAAAGWMRRLRVVRIGFRPRELDLPPIGRDIITLDVEMTPVPALLEPVLVKSGASCPKRDDRLAALSLLEQARAGLLATLVAREAKPAEMVRLHFHSFLRASSEIVDQMRVEIDSTSSSSVSFAAAHSAKDFVLSGFVVNDRDGATFNAPDAETLLDDDFRDGYCFEIRRADLARANQVGLRFIAARSQRGRIDIDGTLWVDTVARELRDIEFTYQNLPSAIARLRPGGQVRFRQLDNGIVIVDRWWMRMPARTVTAQVVGRPVTAPTGAQEAGGLIASARWTDGLHWDAPLAVLRLYMVDSLDAPEPGRTLLLANTSYQAVSDSQGVATINRLLPGPYTGAVRDVRLDSISIALTTSFAVRIADGEKIERRLRVPTTAEYIAGRCRASSSEPDSIGTFMIIGRVFDRANKPVGRALWSISKQTPAGPDMVQAGIASSDGIFEYCAGPFHLNDQIVIDTRRSAEDPRVLLPITLTDRITVVRVTLPLEAR